MVIFMGLFGGKKKKEEPAEPNIPTNLVLQMRGQGLSNNQIIQNLQRSGFSSSQIFDAMNQADIKGNVKQAPMPDIQGDMMENAMGPMGPPMGPPVGQPGSDIYPGEPRQRQMPSFAPPEDSRSAGPSDYGEQRIEELAEAIIDEKWAELVKNINRVIEWKNKVELKINSMEQEIKDLKDSFNELHKALIGKLGEYDKNILDVGTELKAMETVFEKVLPTFNENIAELSRVVKNLKMSQPKLPPK